MQISFKPDMMMVMISNFLYLIVAYQQTAILLLSTEHYASTWRALESHIHQNALLNCPTNPRAQLTTLSPAWRTLESVLFKLNYDEGEGTRKPGSARSSSPIYHLHQHQILRFCLNRYRKRDKSYWNILYSLLSFSATLVAFEVIQEDQKI